MHEPITHVRIQDLLDRSMLILTATAPVDRKLLQTFAADAGKLCCDWLEENGLQPDAVVVDDVCEAGNFPP